MLAVLATAAALLAAPQASALLPQTANLPLGPNSTVSADCGGLGADIAREPERVCVGVPAASLDAELRFYVAEAAARGWPVVGARETAIQLERKHATGGACDALVIVAYSPETADGALPPEIFILFGFDADIPCLAPTTP
ncbi:hypothetical protein [Brevundimonas sp. Root1279]|uniref:hypothetical protein n=1 Tax=Brevundimonas sp. Root1279 TaxID=1736443 RepID=UPI0007002C5E|nr:hypothetical protein [Brevundimonas sp. Root1279]KQW86485.1 hypothetical protein ASC65_00875 [Brevundimonas sp. Root1279]